MILVSRGRLGADRWDAFVDRHLACWFWHRFGWIEYGLALGGDREDLSVAAIEQGAVRGVCPMIREGSRIGFEDEPMPMWIADEARAAALVAGWVDEARSAGLCPRFRSSPLAEMPAHMLSGAPGILSPGWQSRVIDLRKSREQLHAEIRPSYKSLINGIERSHVIVVDQIGAMMGKYIDLHCKTVGIIAPRPARSYALQAEWVRQGYAYLVGAYRGISLDAAAYVFVYKGGAYYGSGPSRTRGIMHAVLWRAITEAQQMGLSRFEVGWRGRAKDEHEAGIETFKAGFGGEDEPILLTETSQ